MKFQKFFYVVLLSAIIFSCKKNQREQDAVAEPSADESKMVSSSAAVVDENSDRKFIRTADLRFKVKNVAQSTYSIENTVAKYGGFVTSTELRSNVLYTTTTKISNDSLLETTRFYVENAMIVRVPNTMLDTTLKTIARQIDYLDYRIIKADDVSLQVLSNQLSRNRNAANQQRVQEAIQNRGKKLGETLDAEDRLHNSQADSDDAKLANLSIKDQINFSTLSLQLYQREENKSEKIANPESDEFRTSLGVRMLDALKTGWHIFEEIIVFIMNLWAFILIGFGIWFLFRKFKSKRMN